MLEFSVAALMDSNWTLINAAALRQVTFQKLVTLVTEVRLTGAGVSLKDICPFSSCLELFPCGWQQLELLSQTRSLWNQPEQLNISRDSWSTLNLTESGEEMITANVTQSEQRGGNETVLRRGEVPIHRIVGGVLEKPGGSPWQVGAHFQSVNY